MHIHMHIHIYIYIYMYIYIARTVEGSGLERLRVEGLRLWVLVLKA